SCSPATPDLYTLSLHDALPISLGAGLEAPDAPLDAELDPLVIAGLEMQAVVVRVRSPVAAEERLLAPEEDRRGHHRAAVHGELRSEEHTSELQSQSNLVCRLLL